VFNFQVFTFGCNDDGALGRVTSEEGSENVPTTIALPAKAIQVSAGDSHSAALLEDGRVFAWGTFRVRSNFFTRQTNFEFIFFCRTALVSLVSP